MNDADFFKSDEQKYFEELVEREVSKRMLDSHMATTAIRKEVEDELRKTMFLNSGRIFRGGVAVND